MQNLSKPVQTFKLIWRFPKFHTLCTILCQNAPLRTRYVWVNPGKGVHKVCKVCAGSGGTQGNAQGMQKVYAQGHPCTRSRKVERAQGKSTVPGDQNTQGAHEVTNDVDWEQQKLETAICNQQERAEPLSKGDYQGMIIPGTG